MSRKRVASPDAAKTTEPLTPKPPKVEVQFRFGEGDTVSLDAVDVMCTVLLQYARMADSDDVELQEQGMKSLRWHAEQCVAAGIAPAMKSAAASHAASFKRTRSAIRATILKVMRDAKRADPTQQFKQFLRSWENNKVDGLRLQANGTKYAIFDENAAKTQASSYELSTLEKMWSEPPD